MFFLIVEKHQITLPSTTIKVWSRYKEHFLYISNLWYLLINDPKETILNNKSTVVLKSSSL